MPGLSCWHFLAAAIMSSHVAGGVSPIRSLRQIIDHVSPSSGSPYVLASGLASPVCACGYWPYAARKYGSYCDVSMFFFTKSVMSRIDPLVTASPMFCESRTGMSKFVLCAANCVKIASCHCAFGTVLTLTVTFGRSFVYSLPSSSSACAGGHSNHRNVSVIGLLESAALVGACVPPPLSPLSPPQAAIVSARATAQSVAETVSLPFIAPPPRGLVLPRFVRPHCEPCTRLAETYGFFASVVNSRRNFLHWVSPWATLHGVGDPYALSVRLV